MKRNGMLQPPTTLLAAATSIIFSGSTTSHTYPLLPLTHFLQMSPRWLTSSDPEAIHTSCSPYGSLPPLMAAEQPRLLERPAVEPPESDELCGSNKRVENGFGLASAPPQTNTAADACPLPDTSITRYLRHCFRRGGDSGFRLLDDALKRGVDPTLIFCSLIEGFCEVGRQRNARNLFERMLQMGWRLDSRTCNALVKAIYEKGKAGTALSLLRMMPKLGCRPSVLTYDRVLKSLSSHSLKHCDRESRLIIADKALELFMEMINIGVFPNSFTYYFLVKCCCSAGKVDLGLNLLADMLKRGCQAKRGMMNALIYELIRENRFGEARMLFDNMAAMRCKPNIYSFNAILKALCWTGDTADVLALYEELKEKGDYCKPNMFTYNTVIAKLCKENAFCQAIHVFDEMLANDLTPNVVTYNIFMDSLCEQKCVQKARQLFNIMVERGEKPTAVSYNILMHAHCLAGEMQTARRIFEAMVAKGIHNTRSYNILCDGYCKNGQMEAADKLLKDMNAAGIPYNDVTNTLLIDAYYKRKMANEARCFMDENGLNLNVITYSSQMSFYCSQNLVDKAANIFKNMIDNNHQPDIVSYYILIKGYCASSRIKEAMEYFEEMVHRGLQPNTVICTVLLQGLLDSNKVMTGIWLYDKMRNSGIKPTMVTYNLMIDGLVKRGYLDEANEIFFHREDYYCQLLSKRQIVMTLFDKMKNIKTER